MTSLGLRSLISPNKYLYQCLGLAEKVFFFLFHFRKKASLLFVKSEMRCSWKLHLWISVLEHYHGGLWSVFILINFTEPGRREGQNKLQDLWSFHKPEKIPTTSVCYTFYSHIFLMIKFPTTQSNCFFFCLFNTQSSNHHLILWKWNM